MSGDTFAIHRALGYFSSPKRFDKWAPAAGLDAKTPFPFAASTDDQEAWLDDHDLGDAMADALVYQGGNACDMARAIFQETGMSRSAFQRARIIFNETYSQYPRGVERILANLSTDFNAIQDAELINGLQKDVVAAVDSASAGLQLAQTVKRVIQKIRKKDRIAANISLITTLLDHIVCKEERQHQKSSEITVPGAREALIELFGLYNRAELSVEALGRLGSRLDPVRRLLEVPPGTANAELLELLSCYMREAIDTGAILK